MRWGMGCRREMDQARRQGCGWGMEFLKVLEFPWGGMDRPENVPRMIPKWSKEDPRMIPKWSVSDEFDSSWTYDRQTWLILDLWVTNLINLEPASVELNLIYLGPMSTELEQSMTHECGAWSILGVWVSNSINFESMNVEPDQFWAYECRTRSLSTLWVSNLSNF